MARPNPIPFDTHRFVKRMTEAGMPASQAEALADEQAALLKSQLATKQDVADLAARQETLATKESVAELVARQETLATKEDVAELAARLDVVAARQDGFATKESVADLAARQKTLATKAEVAELRTEVAVLRARIGLMLWLISSVGGGVAFLVVRTVWTG